MSEPLLVRATPVDDPVAVALLRAYFTEVVARYHRAPATEEQVDAALAEDPSDDLAVFLVGWSDTPSATPVGCVGVRAAGPDTAELTRMFVHPERRGRGLGGLLLAAAEEAAVGLGALAVRLDTRHDLVEARALYARSGYRETAPYSGTRYADHWFTKPLGTTPGYRSG